MINKRYIIPTLLLGGLLVLTSCSINQVRQPIIDTVKTTLDAKKDIETTLIPNGDRNVTIDGKTVTVKASTFDAVKNLINTNNELQKGLVDVVGNTITDENIDTLSYYISKYKLPVEDFLSNLFDTSTGDELNR